METIHQPKTRKQRKAEIELEHLLNGEPPPLKHRKQRKADPDAHLQRAYGMTLEEKHRMINDQRCSCAICFKPLDTSKPKTIAVDHCHTTGKVRGILCRECNLMLGMARDNQQILANAIQYLRASLLP